MKSFLAEATRRSAGSTLLWCVVVATSGCQSDRAEDNLRVRQAPAHRPAPGDGSRRLLGRIETALTPGSARQPIVRSDSTPPLTVGSAVTEAAPHRDAPADIASRAAVRGPIPGEGSRIATTAATRAQASDVALVPAGATAICADGWTSHSAHRRGTCSHHGGVAEWLNSSTPP
jgi:hypothetical protein